jgi:thioredoxin 1
MSTYSGKVIEVSDYNTFKQLLSMNDFVIVDCYAPWCGPCRMIAPYYAGLSVNPSYKHVAFVKVNVEDAAEIAEFLGVSAMPTFYFFRNGQIVDTFTGASSDDLCKALDNLVVI